MAPDIRFFQAAATVIPTLLVAVAVTAKTFDAGTYPDEEAVRQHAKTPEERTERAVKRTLEYAERAWWIRTSLLILVFVALILATVVAERASLAALAENRPTSERMRSVYVGITAELALLALSAGAVLTRPIMNHATRTYQVQLARFLLMTVIVGVGIALSITV